MSRISKEEHAKYNEAQKQMCEANGWPMFVPDGYCYACRASVYERWPERYVTGCLNCGTSFCD